MNCANHADASALAYCRTCGKALCNACTRPVRGVIYCEDCLGARMEGTLPPPPLLPPAPPLPPSAAYAVPPAGAVPNPPGTQGSGPNPTVAGILAGIFPFGVGPVYNGQYAKGLAYLMISALLIYGANHGGDVDWIFGVGFAFFIFYQIVDSVKSAKALQLGQAPPDPLGLGQAFGWQSSTSGDKTEAKRVPVGAVVLIMLGILFLLHTMGLAEFGLDRFWPLILIIVGAWMFARNFGMVESGRMSSDPRYRSKRLMGPAMVLTIGVLLLMSTLDIAHFGRTWPVILLVVGAVKLLQGSVRPDTDASISPPPSDSSQAPPAANGMPVPPASGEVNRG
jgi:cell wall-active antibiotic response 4TMS protein YvqF